MATEVFRQVPTHARRRADPSWFPIVAAKVTAPGMPGWALARPRITKLIAEGRRWCPLTLLTAPAGSGKTTAMALWAAAESGTVAWVTVDGFDNRPGVFWANVVAASRRSGVAVPGSPPAGEGRDAGHVFLLGLAAALAAQDPPVTLVLDDLHLLTDRAVLGGLDDVLRNTGSGLRLLVAAQMDPLLPLRRHRLAGELTEIRASDLAFTVAEAGELMTRDGCTLTAGSLECRTRRTQGCAPGLRLPRCRWAPIPGS
jgi:LuxR family maltose regulon positive regulatory protein